MKKQLKSIYAISFEDVRKAYPGVKRGFDTEFEYFRKKHKDWIAVLPLLLPAVIEQDKKRWSKTSKQYIPHFKTWLNNRCWEETEGVTESLEEREVRMRLRENQERQRQRQKDRDDQQAWLESKNTIALLDLKADKKALVAHWLIDEILQKRKLKGGGTFAQGQKGVAE